MNLLNTQSPTARPQGPQALGSSEESRLWTYGRAPNPKEADIFTDQLSRT
jgi:hypothetical protein